MVEVILAGASFDNQNRGGQALCWGAIEYISQCYPNEDIIISMLLIGSQSDEKYSLSKEGYANIVLNEIFFTKYDLAKAFIQHRVLSIFGIKPKSKLAILFNDTVNFYNINGGDSFSDIYGWEQFYNYTIPSIIAILCKINLVLLPQTIGPFNNIFVKKLSRWILKKADQIFVRDETFNFQLDKWKIKYKNKTDLSFYMKPQITPDIDIKPGSIGINISGLMYFNRYKRLSDQFNLYPELLLRIIIFLQKQKKNIYLIPHTYNINNPIDDDDLSAINDFYSKLPSTANIYILNKDYNAPQLKYIISKMNIFIGSRMHACFAALFSNINTIGIAYSDKFIGSFNNFGLAGNCIRINNMDKIKLEILFEQIIGIINNEDNSNYLKKNEK